ncbi:VWA domain-containing protein [Persephonella sp.]|uniref:VWA domain-containing protein n=1 Tax=Persephonella sp. TaxID=2060922 RepID=UPI00262F0A72|nr:VWA domain-containing protein [Persephonella sp.]
MIEFLDKSFLWLLVPLVILGIYVYRSKVKNRFEFWIAYTVVFLIIISLGKPVLKTGEKTIYRKDTEIVILLDHSLSMEVSDLKPTRLTFALRKLKKLLKELEDEKVGLIIFAEKPEVIFYPFEKITETDIENLMIKAEGSTDILSAFSVANSVLTAKERIVVLVSDGSDEDLSKVVELIKQSGIKIVFYGVATEKGGKVPGYNALSRLNKEMVKIAQSNGIYVKPSQTDEDISRITDFIKDISEKTKTVLLKMHYKTDLSPFLALFSLGIITAGFLLRRFGSVFLIMFLFAYPSYSGEITGYFYYAIGEYKKAASEFLQEKDPENMYNAGLSYYKAGMYLNALSVLKKIKTDDPDLKKKVLYTQSLCYLAQKKYKKAEKILSELIELFPTEEKIRKLYRFVNMVYTLNKKPEKKKTIVKIKEKKSKHFKTAPMEIGEKNPW